MRADEPSIRSKTGFVMELQSLRGVAAAMVMVHHALRCVAPTPVTQAIADRLLNAHAAVVVFFVLSGYVLSHALSASGLDSRTIAIFYARRIFRIYPAMIFAVALGGFYFLAFRSLPAEHLSLFILENYQPERITPLQVVLTFLGLQMVLLPQLWTITVEIAASVVMPAFLFIRTRGHTPLLVLTLVLAVTSFLFPTGNRWILVYLIDFALGTCAYAFRARLRRLVARPVVTAAAAFVLLYFRQLYAWEYAAPLPGLIEALASVLLILGIEREHARFLRWKPLVRLGDWSYSLYLLHVPVAFSLARAIDNRFGAVMSLDQMAALVLLGTVAITMPLAAFSFRWIELPGIALGRRAASLFDEQRRESLPPGSKA
jgi:peptidoglycan/LPS O-acetylase OafA/YrhL